MKFRSIPIEIEAEQYRPEQPVGPAGVIFDTGEQPYVVTIHGQRCYIEPGDWIVPEPDGIHYYPVKPAVFAARYEAVS